MNIRFVSLYAQGLELCKPIALHGIPDIERFRTMSAGVRKPQQSATQGLEARSSRIWDLDVGSRI